MMVAVLIAAPVFLRGDVTVFSDTFGTSQEVSLNEADARERQAGEQAGLDYSVAPGEYDSALDGDQVRLDEEVGLLIENREATFVSVSPLEAFGVSGDGFRLRITLAPDLGTLRYAGDRWAQVHFGGANANSFVAEEGFGILIRADASREDGYQIYHNGEYVGSGSTRAAERYRFDIVVENGELAFTINGELQRPFEGDSPRYPVGEIQPGYVSFGAHNTTAAPLATGFSDFTLSSLGVTRGSVLILSSVSTHP